LPWRLLVRLPAPEARAEVVSRFVSWPSGTDGLVELYPRGPEPVLRANFIASADGAVTVDGLSGGLHGPGDKEIFDSLRMVCDALIVAAGTVRAEKYDALRLTPDARAWRRAHGLAEFPLMVVVSRSLDLDPDQLVFADAPVPPIVVTTTAGAPDFPGAETLRVAGLPEMVRALHDRGARQLLCEGGPSLFGALIEDDLVDELCLSVSPLLVGGGPGRIATGAPAAPRRMSLRHVLTNEDMIFLRYARDQGS
jgi:riboflavin biosynthesis pyrimidine reductase